MHKNNIIPFDPTQASIEPEPIRFKGAIGSSVDHVEIANGRMARVAGSTEVAPEVAPRNTELSNKFNVGSEVALFLEIDGNEPISMTAAAIPMPHRSNSTVLSEGELLSQLLDACVTEIRKFVYLRPDRMYIETVALWAAATHVFKYSNEFPRLLATSPEPDCGKSTLMKVLQFICRKSDPFSNASEAAILRRIGRAKQDTTIILDDAENFVDGKHTSLLNAGAYRFGSKFLRCKKNKEGNYEDEEFDVYVPIAMARIGEVPVRSTQSRCIEINVPKAKDGDEVVRFQPDKHGKTLDEIRKGLSRWAEAEGHKLKNYDPQLPPGLINRNADVWRFMFAIADLAGGHWPETARSAARLITLGSVKRGQTDEIRRHIQSALNLIDNSPRDWMQWDIHKLANGNLRISSKGLLHFLAQGSTKYKNMTQQKLAEQIQKFDIQPTSIKVATKEGPKVIRGYKSEEFLDMLARYGSGGGDEP